MPSSSSVESQLTRELELRFIDARSITAEARMALGIIGYPSKDQLGIIKGEAIRIYHAKTRREQDDLRRANWELDAIKLPNGSLSSRDNSDPWLRQQSTAASITSESLTTSSASRVRRAMQDLFRRGGNTVQTSWGAR